MRRAARLGVLLALVGLCGQAGAMEAWHTRLTWQQRSARMTPAAAGGFVLHAPDGTRAIAAQAWRADTASVLFDGLFAMAQNDLRKDAVSAITDPGWNHGQPIACDCFIAGKQWPFTWTRDLSYSTDLALWRFDAPRARRSLLFRLSTVRDAQAPQGLYVMQDTGSGGSWPISTDRVVWFLGARHLLGDAAFARKTWRALRDTLAQDREYAFDARVGLYRGETSFMDWRQQTYPSWTADNVRFIAQSYALSTNVLHYEALQLGVKLAREHADAMLTLRYTQQAVALKAAINRWFWNPARGLYRSYLGGGDPPLPVDAYDLLGTALAITSGVAEGARAQQALDNYPAWPAGSPVIWPERVSQPVYHNRALWPFVSAYALRAARVTRNPVQIAHALRSLLRAAALSGSNMENFALPQLSTHLPGKLGGPVVDSRRQLWSVAGYLNMVVEGVFGMESNGRIAPEIPVILVPMLFGARDTISLHTPTRSVILQRPATLDGNLLVADRITREGVTTRVRLKAIRVAAPALRRMQPEYAPATPAPAQVRRAGAAWQVRSAVPATLWLDGRAQGQPALQWRIPAGAARQCLSLTTRAQGMDSLPSHPVCVGETTRVEGAWPRRWSAPVSGDYFLRSEYENTHGPISTGITAAVKRIAVQCGDAPAQIVPMVMPQAIGTQRSSVARFHAQAGARCSFSVLQGFNMSDLTAAALYTGGEGGVSGPLNAARIGALLISPAPASPARMVQESAAVPAGSAP
ncbi:Six-hairpin glycosidase-like protein [Metallibacterium scheffleri]|uniref:Six-hairpin glycosidase-like protein n=1 Tax=Metallibacterium scheffleri TaxID=993689 RepID=UPI0023F1C85F|nr:Six-hairpin glycosidase-like protein [Metallibacterium scheffleri]